MALNLVYELAITIIVFLGLYIGLLLGVLARDELKAGKKYFVALQKILFILTVFYMFSDLGFGLIGTGFLVFFVVILFTTKNEYERLLYFVMAPFLFMSFFTEFLVVPTLIFVYGLPTGSLYYLRHLHRKPTDVAKLIFFQYGFFVFLVFALLAVRIVL